MTQFTLYARVYSHYTDFINRYVLSQKLLQQSCIKNYCIQTYISTMVTINGGLIDAITSDMYIEYAFTCGGRAMQA